MRGRFKVREPRRAAMLRNAATLSVLGFTPRAPGTAGTLAAIGFVALVDLPWPLYLGVTAAVTALGVLAAGEVERTTGEKDPGCIVIDEFVGYLAAMALLPPTWTNLIAAFVLFRFFDIVKPPPIRQLQKLPGGLGVMADDLAAGAAANILIRLWMVQPWI